MFLHLAIAAIAVLVSAAIVQAEPDINSSENDPFAQVTSVSELKDVEPSDWAFQALRELVERYGCIAGYSDNTFRGDRAVTRWEFAAGLNACLQQIERLLQENIAISRQDAETLQRLAKEFETELTTLGMRVDNLESRVAFLEDRQFSTTTKLVAQTIWSVSDTFGNRIGGGSDESQTQFAYRIRLNLETSFTGEDLLRTRLQISNFGSIDDVTGTNMTRLNYDDNSDNRVQIPHLLYRTPLTDNLALTIGPVGIGYTDITDTLTPPTIADDGLGIPSRFGEYNPLYRRGGGGGALNWNITKDLLLTVGYVAGDANDPEEGNGLFNGSYNALAQLAYYWDSGVIGFAYSRSYFPKGEVNLTGDTGSLLAIEPFGDEIATSSDFFTLQGYYRITPNFQIHGWGGYVRARAEGSGVSNIADGIGGTTSLDVSDGDSANLWYGAIGLSFPDVGGEGNLPGILVGLPPQVTNSDVREDRDTSYHLEAFYRLKINDNIAITPGFWVILNPENDSRNDTQWVGHLRTTFNF
jgi:Carbohydrate-selective porin, OprB family/S-layer homology domain